MDSYLWRPEDETAFHRQELELTLNAPALNDDVDKKTKGSFDVELDPFRNYRNTYVQRLAK